MNPNQLLDLSSSLPPATYNSTSGASLFSRSSTAQTDDWVPVLDNGRSYSPRSSPTQFNRADDVNNPFLHRSEVGRGGTNSPRPTSYSSSLAGVLPSGQMDDDITPSDAPPSYTRHATDGTRTLEGGPPRPLMAYRQPAATQPPISASVMPAYGAMYERYAPQSPPPARTGSSPILPFSYHDVGSPRPSTAATARSWSPPRGEHPPAKKLKRQTAGGRLCGCLGYGKSGEKAALSRKKKLCIFAIIIFSISAIAIGTVASQLVKRNSTKYPSLVDANSVANTTFPELPLGQIYVMPYEKPQTVSDCAEKEHYWSCILPADTKYPTTRATSDPDTVVPEFSFFITSPTSQDQYDLTRDPDGETASDNDYKALASIDDVRSQPLEGEASNYLISQAPLSTGSETRTSIDDTLRTASETVPNTMINQPLRFFNRGLADEHYGAHIYFDKTIHLSTSLDVELDDNGGSTASKAKHKIVFEQTRFKIKIYTKMELQLGSSAINGRPATTTPIEIWEDRANPKRVTAYTFTTKERDYVVERRMREVTGLNPRGCSCTWANFRIGDSDKLLAGSR